MKIDRILAPVFSDLQHIAHHEAGHAVLGILFNEDIEILTIVQSGDAGGSVQFDRSGDDLLRDEGEEAYQVRFERRIMSAMAGEMAQRIFDPESVEDHHGQGDRLMTLDYLDALRMPTDEIRDACLTLLRLRAEWMLKENWDSVERIASLLLLRGTISGEEARQAFADPRFSEGSLPK